jgi:hypothetical protein
MTVRIDIHDVFLGIYLVLLVVLNDGGSAAAHETRRAQDGDGIAVY